MKGDKVTAKNKILVSARVSENTLISLPNRIFLSVNVYGQIRLNVYRFGLSDPGQTVQTLHRAI